VVTTTNRAPVMEVIPAASIKGGERLTIVVNATDPDGDKLTYTATGLPVNATFDAGNRTFAWTTVYRQTGNYTVTFRVSDGVLSATKTAAIMVTNTNRAPVMEKIPAASIKESRDLKIVVNATDADGDKLTYTATNLPVNAAFDAKNRTLTWKPASSQTGNYTVTFRVSDGVLSDMTNATIMVYNSNLAPVLESIPATSAYEGKSMTLPVHAADPDGDVLSYTATNLPPFAVFNAANHTFTWTPEYVQAGVYTVTFRVSDGVLSDVKTATITVYNTNRAPEMEDIPAVVADEGTFVTLMVYALDPDDNVLSYTAANLPNGAVFNAASHTFTWTPGYDQAGVYTVTFRVSDGQLSVTKNVKITVRNNNLKMNVPVRKQTTTATPIPAPATPKNANQTYYIQLQ
jgi:PKD repeat protein